MKGDEYYNKNTDTGIIFNSVTFLWLGLAWRCSGRNQP
jgi:hypothetical protein